MGNLPSKLSSGHIFLSGTAQNSCLEAAAAYAVALTVEVAFATVP